MNFCAEFLVFIHEGDEFPCGTETSHVQVSAWEVVRVSVCTVAWSLECECARRCGTVTLWSGSPMHGSPSAFRVRRHCFPGTREMSFLFSFCPPEELAWMGRIVRHVALRSGSPPPVRSPKMGKVGFSSRPLWSMLRCRIVRVALKSSRAFLFILRQRLLCFWCCPL